MSRSVLELGSSLILLLLFITSGCDHTASVIPKGDILTYEIDPTSIDSGQRVNMREIAAVIDCRLTSPYDKHKLAVLKILDHQRIEVSLIDNNPLLTEAVKRRMASTGKLEFRFLADKEKDQVLVEKALASPSEKFVRGGNGKFLGWWVPVQNESQTGIEKIADIVTRDCVDCDQHNVEVLIVDDIFDVTGAYLIYAQADRDPRGKFCISFQLNEEGGRLFGGLTGSRLPNPAVEKEYHLGIIVNGKLISALIIRGQIFSRGEISGNFSIAEAQDLAAVLKSGELPVRLQLINTASPADKDTDPETKD